MTQEEFISEFYSCDNEEEALKKLYSKMSSYKDLFLEECENSKRLLWENDDLEHTIRKTINKLELLVDTGSDYDDFSKEESLKTLINVLLRYAKESITILKGEDKNDR